MTPALDPLRIKADAALVRGSANRVVEAALTRRAAMDRQGKYDQPLLVVLGEIHSIPAHYVHHMLVMEGLRSREKIAVAYEAEHDTLEKEFGAQHDGQPHATQRLRDRDDAGLLSLKTAVGFCNSTMTDHTSMTLFSYLLRHGLPFRFTDAACNARGFLDTEDPSTAAALRDCFGAAARIGGHPGTARGIGARNRHMLAGALSLAKVSGARIVIQVCGNLHVLGDGLEGIAADNSIAVLAKNTGAGVLAVPLVESLATGTFRQANIPLAHGLAADELMVVSGLPEIHAVYDPGTNRPDPDMPAALDSREAEAAYVCGMMKGCALAYAALSVADRRLEAGLRRVEIRKIYKECLEESRVIPARPSPLYRGSR